MTCFYLFEILHSTVLYLEHNRTFYYICTCMTSCILFYISCSAHTLQLLNNCTRMSLMSKSTFIFNFILFRWKHTTPEERCHYLMKIADLIEQNLDELALLESLDQGKPVSLARTVDIPRAVHNFRHFATAFLHRVDM